MICERIASWMTHIYRVRDKADKLQYSKYNKVYDG